MNIQQILIDATDAGASDIFIVAGRPLTMKKNGTIVSVDEHPLTPEETKEMVSGIYQLNGRNMQNFENTGDDDFSFSLPGVSRFRVSTFRQRGSFSAVIRIITFQLPDPMDLMIPNAVMELANYNNGMVLVTGPAGGGKSTTLACIIDKINHEKSNHIITLEDPLEYLHRHANSIVTQREINTDTDSYLTALRAALRQSPDVILLGEMRDFETMNVAVTAAETGHLIFSTLHTIGASNTIDRIIDTYPPAQQRQIAIQLSSVLQAVVSQKLLPSIDGRMIPAFEIMVLTPAIRNLIREGKVHQIDGLIYASQSDKMISMDTSIYNLCKQGLITSRTAISHATNPEMLQKRLNL